MAASLRNDRFWLSVSGVANSSPAELRVSRGPDAVFGFVICLFSYMKRQPNSRVASSLRLEGRDRSTRRRSSSMQKSPRMQIHHMNLLTTYTPRTNRECTASAAFSGKSLR
jgi:hypothetical protein